MKHLAILGRQPEFGLVELESQLGQKSVQPFGQAAIVDRRIDIDKFGGVQKFGRILYHGPIRDLNEAPLNLDRLPLRDGKTPFGLSYYGVRATNRYVLAAGLTFKKRLKSKGSLRLVSPQKGTSLTAAQVKFNSLLRNGFELLVVQHKKEMIIGVTDAVQDIDWYAERDYERPIRSAKVGMLPPKLAQIMVNTTSAPLVVDPFVGTGVVLQEALLLGRSGFGSDIAPEMVEASRKNTEWLKQKRDLKSADVMEADATSVSLPSSKLAIVSEGYLGPNQSTQPSDAIAKRLRNEARELYSKSLRNWAKQIPVGTDVTITAPVWHTKEGWLTSGIVDLLSDLGYDLRSFASCDSRNLIYRRPNQIVGRQLLLLRKS